MRFPLGGGINGLAAQQRRADLDDRLHADPRIPHEGNDDDVADRLGLCGMAAAPLRAPGRRGHRDARDLAPGPPRDFDAEELDLLQGLADQAAIAITNSTLLARLRQSEARFRDLVQTTPDVIYRCDADGRFLFVAEGAEALFGWTPAEVADLTFADLTAEESLPRGARELRGRSARSTMSSAGSTTCSGIATGRPSRARSRRSRSGRTASSPASRAPSATSASRSASNASCATPRSATGSSSRTRPDVVFSTDAEGNFTFMSEAMERMTGWTPERGRSAAISRRVVDEGSSRDARAIGWAKLVADPATEQVVEPQAQRARRPARPRSRSAPSAWSTPDGKFAGHPRLDPRHQRARPLERELRESEERYRYLVASSPDLVWLTDAEGHAHVHQRRGADDARHRRRRADRPAVRRVLRPDGRARRRRSASAGCPPPDGGPPDAPAVPPRRRPRRPGRDQRHGHDRRTAASSGPTAPPATSANATASSATCAARRASSPPARSAPTWPASCTTR